MSAIVPSHSYAPIHMLRQPGSLTESNPAVSPAEIGLIVQHLVAASPFFADISQFAAVAAENGALWKGIQCLFLCAGFGK